MASFNERLQQATSAFGGRYDCCMRRSFQTAIMYEANRCLKDKLQSLRPFQRKLAFYDQAMYLLEEISGESSLVGLELPRNREEIMWKTVTSRELLNPETMWARGSKVLKEVEKVAEQVRKFMRESPKITPKSTNEEVYRYFVQSIYDRGRRNFEPGSEPYPVQFEFTHSHLLLSYKMYFYKGELDPTFPMPLQREICVPRDKPPGGLESYNPILTPITVAKKKYNWTKTRNVPALAPTPPIRESPLIVTAGQKASAEVAYITSPEAASPEAASAEAASATSRAVRASVPLSVPLKSNGPTLQQQHVTQSVHHGTQTVSTTQQSPTQEQNDQRRRELLKEVKDHLDLLREFEGIVDSETLKKRKRDLFLSLLSPPPLRNNGRSGKHAGEKSGESDTESDEYGSTIV